MILNDRKMRLIEIADGLKDIKGTCWSYHSSIFGYAEALCKMGAARAKPKEYYQNGIKKLEGRYNRCIALEGNYVE